MPSVTVEGRPHNIEQHERPGKSVVDVFAEECYEQGNTTIIFTDGKRSLKSIENELNKMYPDGSLEILLLHSKVDEATRQRIFQTTQDDGVHRVIISTSAGQSGITIPGVDRVISDGWTKSPELDAENASGLPRRLCSRDELIQQMGRGGRDVAGAKFFLANPLLRTTKTCVSPDRFVSFHSRKREDHTPADIYHTVITRNVMSAAAMDKDFYTLNEYLIHKVTFGTIKEAYTVLRLIGAVDEHNKVTPEGRVMDRLSLRPELARAVVASAEDDMTTRLQVLAIACAIEAGGFGSETNREQRDARLSTDTNDDFLAELDLFMAARRHHSVRKGDISISYDSYVGRVIEVHKDIEYDVIDELGVANDGLDPINVSRGVKQFGRMCRVLNITDEDLASLTNTLTHAQRRRLRERFLTGMPHLLYEEVSRTKYRGRKVKQPDGSKKAKPDIVHYRNILGPPQGTSYDLDRRPARSSVLAAAKLAVGTMIAGYPRWYEDDDGEVHHVIDQGFPTTPTAVKRILGARALDIRHEVHVGPDGRLMLDAAAHIGRMSVHHSSERVRTTAETYELLANEALERPGPAQMDLRKLKGLLDDLYERVPASRTTYFFKSKNPRISDQQLRQIVLDAAKDAGSLGELDARIRRKQITLDRYIAQDMLHALYEYYPSELAIGGQTFTVEYSGENAQPVIVLNSSDSIHGAPEMGVYLRDGTEVKFRYRHESDQLYSAREVLTE